MGINIFNRVKDKPEHRVRILMALVVFMSVGLLAFESVPASVAAAKGPDFSNEVFQATWSRTDKPIADTRTSRSWYWGPQPLTVGFMENYADSPGKKREIQYFDKARMEVNNPSQGVITNGLLVVEMINGHRQDGDKLFTNVGPSSIPIAGDASNTWPTYAGLAGAYMQPKDKKVGQTVNLSWTHQGAAATDKYQDDPAVKIATQQNGLGIPAGFWDFLNRKGTIYTNGGFSDATISEWLFSTGLPITEAYWTRVKVGGVEKDVLFQAFERRTLTYTPANPADYRVEMGNVGWHYLTWRYPNGAPTVSDVPPSSKPQLPAAIGLPWYIVTGDALNIRTAPTSKASIVEHTSNHPFLQTALKGNRVQAIRTVQGEEIEPGNNTWLQIYENPNLYVYSGYTARMVLPDYPTPARTHKGTWVSISIAKQMMAIFDGDRLVYKTLIASGIPNSDPAKDHRTPTGIFKINGSYRPASQTMSGGGSDKASPGYYKLDDIRNVSYFFEDYAIHGSYWHASYGIAPQSHGCVNATVYDAGVIFKLPAGTVVDVI
ncbi:MAG: hypothetical protein JWP00_2435 [Chloroflexi bacterium]|jgi:hypothetical protein|nr:hypothetical protein [Chloroflexota bacterium]